MYPRLAAQIRTQLQILVDQYDAQLRAVPGYANIPESARRDWGCQMLTVMADCLEAGDDTAVISYIHERAKQLLARGFEPEWLQQAIILAEQMTTPLIETVAEGNFVWRAMNRAQAASWQIIADERRRIELTLRESEDRYQTIFNSTPIMFWLKDAHNRTLRINRAAAALEGVQPADVEGKSAYDLYPHEQAEAFYQDDLAVINSGQPKLGIIEQHTSVGTGKLMWLETGKTPVYNDQGEVVGVLAFGIDITDRQQAEAKLRESEEQYRRAITAAGAVPYYIDYATERYRFIGEAIGLLLGYPIEEVTPTLLGQLIQETIMTGQGSALRREIAIQQARTGDLSSWNADYRLVDRLGQNLWLHDSSVQILDESGKPIGAIGILQDVTERKQTEESLHHSTEQQERTARQLRAALEAANELIQTRDLDTLYRRIVELARERFDVERCGLYLLDESRQYLLGTFGTDDQRRTTDERGAQRTAAEFEVILMAGAEQLWVVRETPHVFFQNGTEHTVGAGWVVGTVLRGAAGPIGILFNDNALSGQEVDRIQQEALAVYCTTIGSIIERKRLEEQVQASLTRRVAQVQTSTEVAQEIAAATDLNELFERVVTLIKERFDYYHAQIFRYDPAQDAVVLVAGYGEVGQTMLAAGHTLPMGRGVVGSAAATGASILATDVRQAEGWRPNPNLPETRGELAVPIKLRDQVLGILDVQSTQANTLSADDQLLLEGLCGQIASAMESTRLLEELRRGEAELSQALQIAKLAYWEYDVEKDLFLFNDQFYSIFHTTAEQQGGYQLSSAQYAGKFVYPDDLPVVGSEIEKALNSADRHYSRDLVHRIQYADGGVGYMSVSINIDRDEQGRILRYYGANQDITAAKLGEVELEKFKLGLERSTAAIFITDRQGVITFVNSAFEKIYGFPREEAIGQTPRIIKSGLIPQEQYKHFWETLLVGQTVAGELINKTKDGRLIPIEGSNNPIQDENGTVIGFLGMHTDITARKQVEEELARSAQLLNTIINTSRDLIYIKNTKSEFLIASQALARLMGVKSANELIGKSDFDFFPYELANKYYIDEQKILQAGEPLIDIEEPTVYPDGTQAWLTTSKVPYRAADGTLLGILGIGRDITERKRAEQQMEETLRETERLYAAVSAEGWQTFRQSGQLPQGYRFDRALLQPADQIWEPEMAQAVNEVKTIATHDERRAVAVTPLAVRGEIIGALGVYDNPDQPLQAEELALVEAASEQVALALESARLFDQTQRDAERERTISAISERIYSTSDVRQLMQITAEELRRATGSARAVVRLNLGSGNNPEKLAHPDGGSETSDGRTIR